MWWENEFRRQQLEWHLLRNVFSLLPHKVWSLFVLLGEALLHRDLSCHSTVHMIGISAIHRSIRRAIRHQKYWHDASTRGRRQWHLFFSASREGLLHETPAKVLEQYIELFRSRRGEITIRWNNVCALVFESCETKLGQAVMHDQTHKRIGGLLWKTILFVHYRGSKLLRNAKKSLKGTYRTGEKRKKSCYVHVIRFFITYLVKNNPTDFHVPTPKNAGAKDW